MSLDLDVKDIIRSKFEKLNDIEALADLLNFVYLKKFPKKSGNIRVNISPKDLNYYAFDRRKNPYITFDIKKKSGGKRTIHAPRYKLKTIQKCLNEVFNTIYCPHKNAYGFVPEKSVIENALPHVGKQYVYNIDIKDFFPATSFRRIKTVLTLAPFNLNGTTSAPLNREPLAFLIANLCCDQGCLPQGAPTSPTLTNIVCRRLDKKLTHLAKKYRASYTRYADDITFSSYRRTFNNQFKAELKEIIEEEEYYKINPAKERLQSFGERQMVTGLVVNTKCNVPRSFMKDIRFWIMCWKKFGLKATQNRFEDEFKNKKSFVKYKGKAPQFYEYLYGKILYFGMVKGKDDLVFMNFYSQLTLLFYKHNLRQKTNLLQDIRDLLEEWELNGLENILKTHNERWM